MRGACLLLALAGSVAAQEVGEQAPPIAAEGWLNALEGEKPSLDAFKGHPVLLEFWDTG
jgi:hypothetical protein